MELLSGPCHYGQTLTDGRADLFSLAQVIVFVISRNSNYVSMMGLSVKLKAKADSLFLTKSKHQCFSTKSYLCMCQCWKKVLDSKYIVILMKYSHTPLIQLHSNPLFSNGAIQNVLITLFRVQSYRFNPLLIQHCQEDR